MEKEKREKARQFLAKNDIDCKDIHTHFCGIPTGERYGSYIGYVHNPDSTSDGYDGYIVTDTHVMRGWITSPYTYHDWRIGQITRYSTPEELVALLPTQVKKSVSCWD